MGKKSKKKPPARPPVPCDRCSESVSAGDVKRCAKCGIARYCGRSCQVAHWPDHKATCKAAKVEQCSQCAKSFPATLARCCTKQWCGGGKGGDPKYCSDACRATHGLDHQGRCDVTRTYNHLKKSGSTDMVRIARLEEMLWSVPTIVSSR